MHFLLYLQEQPGFHAHEAVKNQRQQVHPGPEQLSVRQRAGDHPLLLQPQAADQRSRAHVPPVPRGHPDTLASSLDSIAEQMACRCLLQVDGTSIIASATQASYNV